MTYNKHVCNGETWCTTCGYPPHSEIHEMRQVKLL